MHAITTYRANLVPCFIHSSLLCLCTMSVQVLPVGMDKTTSLHALRIPLSSETQRKGLVQHWVRPQFVFSPILRAQSHLRSLTGKVLVQVVAL